MDNDNVLKQLISTMNPIATMSDSIRVNRLPTLSNDMRTNKVLWNTLGSIVSAGTTAALLTALAHKVNKRKWEKKNKQIIEDKVNSLYAISAPNYESDPSSITDVRKLGLDGLSKGASFNDGSGRGVYDWIKDIGIDTVVGAIPVSAAIIAAAAASPLINKKIKKNESKTLDQEILDKRNTLAALQAKYIELGLAGGLHKNNSAQDTSEGIGYLSLAGGVLGATATGLLATLVYNYMNKKDNNRKTVEALEDIIAENSTNIPQRISLKLGIDGRPARTRKDQQYIEQLNEVAQSADKVSDFSDKLTEIKKDALFS